MLVSFVIPAHNEERLIGATVDALTHAIGVLNLDAEIVVACDACTDRTRELAQRHGARTVEIKKKHIAATRNAGAQAARGDILIFVDADTLVPAETIAEALAAIRRGAVGGGAVFEFDGPLPLYTIPIGWLTRAMTRLFRFTGGAFLFCTRDALTRAGGWDESVFVSEEIWLAASLKRFGRFVIVRSPVLTSGRKLRTHTAGEILMLMVRASISPGMLRSRHGLDLWYGPRREDPHRPAPARPAH